MTPQRPEQRSEVPEQPRRRIHHEVLNLTAGRNGLNNDPKSQNTKEPVMMNRKKDPSRCTGQAASVRKYRTYHLVHCPHKDASASSGPVGGTDTGWLAEEVENLAPSIVAPGNRRSPTIRPITKYTKNCPSDTGLLVQGTEVPEH